MGQYYTVYSDYLKNRYGQKVYKLPVNIPCGCPNRDGTVGTGGCIYCGEKGGGNELQSVRLSVTQQLTNDRALIEKKYHAHRFIAYFQSFSNTYLPLERFVSYIEEAAAFPDVVGLAVSTRPDCLTPPYLEALASVQRETGIDICIELGLQSASDQTLNILNRGHTVDQFMEAAHRVRDMGFDLCTHLITDLPWDNDQDVLNAAKVLKNSRTNFLKIHSLYVEKNTELERMVRSGEISLLSAEDYIRRTILLLTHIPSEIVIERLIGRVPECDSVCANWHISWWKIRDLLLAEMQHKQLYQGIYINLEE